MLAVGRVLAARPRVLLLDELSLGLAPLVVDRLLEAVRRQADDGCAVLLVEQHVQRAIKIADRAYVLRRGEVVIESAASDLADGSALEAIYLSAHTSASEVDSKTPLENGSRQAR